MPYDTDEHARSCKAITITSIGFCKKVTEVIFYKFCHFVSRTALIYSQPSPTVQFVASAYKGALAPTLRTSALTQMTDKARA